MPYTTPSALTREVARAAVEGFDDFVAGLRRSRKGNLWRNYEGANVTVFQRQDDGRYSWCVATSSKRVRYSRERYSTERDAVVALFDEVGGW